MAQRRRATQRKEEIAAVIYGLQANGDMFKFRIPKEQGFSSVRAARFHVVHPSNERSVDGWQLTGNSSDVREW